MNKNLKIFLMLMMASVTGCSYRDLKDPQKSTGNLPSMGSSMGFAQIQASVLGPKCARCHQWTSNYEAVKGLSGEIQSRVNSPNPNLQMPPINAAPLSAEEKSVLLSWLAAGAPKDPGNSPNPPGPVNPEPEQPNVPRLSYANVNNTVFQPKCASCHSGMLSSYESVVANLSQIESRVRSTLDFEKMPPPRATQLTQEEFLLLTDWIKAGAPKGAQPPPTPPNDPNPVPSPNPPDCDDDLKGKKGDDDDCKFTI